MSIVLLVSLQSLAIALIFSASGIVGSAVNNLITSFERQVYTRGNYLEDELVTRRANVSGIVETLGDIYTESRESYAEERSERNIVFEDYFVERAIDPLISTITTNLLNAVELVLIGDNPSNGRYYGLELRTDTPLSVSSDTLYMSVASSYIQGLLAGRATNPATQCEFRFDVDFDDPACDYITKPYKAAVENKDKLSSVRYNAFEYWAPPHPLADMMQVITYSVPLYKGNQVFGVLGASMYVSTVRKSMSHVELSQDNAGAYILSQPEGDNSYKTLTNVGSDYIYLFGEDERMTLTPTRKYDCDYYTARGTAVNKKVIAYVKPLNFYVANAHYKSEEWTLNAIIEEDALLGYADRMTGLIVTTVVLTAVISLILIIAMLVYLMRPIMRLPEQIKKLKSTEVAKIPRTKIYEIDEMINSIEDMSASIRSSTDNASHVMRLTGMQICSFQINKEARTFSFTSGMGEVTGRAIFDNPEVTYDDLVEYIARIENYRVKGEQNLFSYVDDKGGQKYITVHVMQDSQSLVGVIQDVSEERKDKYRIEFERDHDVLTGLLNRRAFLKAMDELFATGEPKYGAMMLVDIDNLKQINDTYGHEYGDDYIRHVGRALRNFIPEASVMVSRMSGDEFTLFIYGYDDTALLKRDVESLKDYVREQRFDIGGETNVPMRCSGGMVYYPQDSTDVRELIRFADYALYEVKHGHKGEFGLFDKERFYKQEYNSQNYESLNKLIENNLVSYVFQPIVNVKTGKAYAYESLMRSKDPAIKSPTEILALAHAQHKLRHIERMTWFNSLEAYRKYEKEFGGRQIFINSIANQILSDSDLVEISEKYSDVLDKIVIEFTEEERLVDDLVATKRASIKKWKGKLAVDDYGAGYSTDSVLLMLEPDFVKVDMYIIRGIDKNKSKQRLLKNLVDFAHERRMKVVAEGVETSEELKSVIEAGVDFVQGFYLQKPAEKPCEISNELTAEIVSLYKRKSKNK